MNVVSPFHSVAEPSQDLRPKFHRVCPNISLVFHVRSEPIGASAASAAQTPHNSHSPPAMEKLCLKI
jgi:hypothetical protein